VASVRGNSRRFFVCAAIKFLHTDRMFKLTNSQIREYKSRGQLLKPVLKVGHDGLSPQFIAAVDDALKHQELIKVKFGDLKDQKKELAPQLAEKTNSYLIMRVGNVVVLYRRKPTGPAAEAATGE
jgi:RNA-binding protein